MKNSQLPTQVAVPSTGATSALIGPGELSEREFERLRGFIHQRTGIALTRVKTSMLEARLIKRLRDLGISTFGEYSNYLFSSEGIQRELDHFINVVTTNKTEFFREAHHFDYLVRHAIPALKQAYGFAGEGLRAWSAACSAGHEPYSLAMALAADSAANHRYPWSILATDISTKVLETATRAVYTEEDVAPVPAQLKSAYLLRSKDRDRQRVKIAPELREKITFRRLNLMDQEYGFKSGFHIIFCRNVIIYFDKPTQIALLQRLHKCLLPGGYLFLGHSETLNGIPLEMQLVGPTVYRRKARAA
jgi:chemotaxis protein methyltransferase CheR